MDLDRAYEALKTIQEACSEQCEECLLGTKKGMCKILESVPSDWIIKKPDPVIRLME